MRSLRQGIILSHWQVVEQVYWIICTHVWIVIQFNYISLIEWKCHNWCDGVWWKLIWYGTLPSRIRVNIITWYYINLEHDWLIFHICAYCMVINICSLSLFLYTLHIDNLLMNIHLFVSKPCLHQIYKYMSCTRTYFYNKHIPQKHFYKFQTGVQFLYFGISSFYNLKETTITMANFADLTVLWFLE